MSPLALTVLLSLPGLLHVGCGLTTRLRKDALGQRRLLTALLGLGLHGLTLAVWLPAMPAMFMFSATPSQRALAWADLTLMMMSLLLLAFDAWRGPSAERND